VAEDPNNPFWFPQQLGQPAYDLRLEEASGTITYIGEADPGSAEASPVWRIKRMDTSSGIVLLWASGSSDFNKTWNDRASYVYS
jgi:hypothetical protein